VRYDAVHSYSSSRQSKHPEACIILSLGEKMIVRHSDNSVYKDEKEIKATDIESRDLDKLGANPFEDTHMNIRPVAFTFSSILFNLNVLGERGEMFKEPIMSGVQVVRCNWNPYVYDVNGGKQYYQRPFVWTIEEKRLLLDSMYHGIDCGKIIVRKREWKDLERMAKNGETEIAFNDIVDGKQRLNALKEFIEGKYADSDGNYYGDLSYYSQRKLTENQLFSYAEMDEKTKDSDVIHQFLKLNFTGVPQSKEHIEFVKSLQSKI
jgi:hypothetical protein